MKQVKTIDCSALFAVSGIQQQCRRESSLDWSHDLLSQSTQIDQKLEREGEHISLTQTITWIVQWINNTNRQEIITVI